jgi:Cu-Zn family superoxide dismutase
MKSMLIGGGFAVLLLAAAAMPASAQTANANLKSADGKDVGSVKLTQLPEGVLLTVSLKGVPAGAHAFHVHAVGKCEPPFTTASWPRKAITRVTCRTSTSRTPAT